MEYQNDFGFSLNIEIKHISSVTGILEEERTFSHWQPFKIINKINPNSLFII